MSRCFSIANCLFDDYTTNYGVQMNPTDDILRSTLKSAELISTKHIFYPNIGGNISEPSQVRHKHIVLRAGFLCSADFSCFLPGHKIKQIANIEFEDADGGRLDIFVLL